MNRRAFWILLLACVCALVLGWKRASRPSPVTEELEDFPVPYTTYFKHYAPLIDWDWELLAAVGWTESHCNPLAQSGMGARGVMQLMPKTGYKLGLNDSTFWVPEDNIRAGAMYIRLLQHKWSFIHNKEEQTKFVLASYNAGPGGIFAARREVRDAGGNSYTWREVAPHVQPAHISHYVNQVLRTAERIRREVNEREKENEYIR